MNLWPQSPMAVAQVVAAMRQADRDEIYATRWTDSQSDLVNDCMACGGFGWVAGLDRPIAVIGAAPLHPGVWSVYMFATDDFRRIAFDLTKLVKRVMMPALVSAGAHRAECKSLASHETAHKWLSWLGAKHEADLLEYGRGGENFRLYVWRKLDVLPKRAAQG